MNSRDFNIDEVLRRSRVPERSAEYLEQFPRQVTARLRQERQDDAAPANPKPRFALAWSLAAAGACTAAMLAFFLWSTARVTRPTEETHLAQAVKLLREITAMFPDRLQAIVFDKRSVELKLADTPTALSSVPLFVSICRAGNCRNFITYSGQRIQSDGELFDVLLDARGHVMLVGRALVWSSATPGESAGDLRINAKPLGRLL